MQIKIIDTKTGDILGTVISNHSLDLYTACELAGCEEGHGMGACA